MHEAEILKEIRERRSLTGLSSSPVPREILNNLLKAASLAPSCFNNQPWKYIIADQSDVLEEIHKALPSNNKWAEKAPAVVIAIAGINLDLSLSDHRDYSLFDTGLSVMNLILQAQKEGIIAHPMAGFNSEKIREHFHIPEKYIIISVIALGYPGKKDEITEEDKTHDSSERSRKPIDEIASFNKWRCC